MPDNKKETLFDNKVDDIFLKSCAKNKRPKTDPNKIWCRDYFYIFSSSKDKVFYKYFFELHDHFIICKKK